MTKKRDINRLGLFVEVKSVTTNGKIGRPRKPIDWKEAERLCVMQCSQLEIADWFHISVDTLERRLKEEKHQSFAEFFSLHRVQGKIALRRNLFKLAEKQGHVAIFLAKNWLGMVERQEIEASISEEIQHKVKITFEHKDIGDAIQTLVECGAITVSNRQN